MDLGCTHGWEVTMEYDIQQHDLSSLNITVLTVIATHVSIQPPLVPAVSSMKCQIASKASPQLSHTWA